MLLPPTGRIPPRTSIAHPRSFARSRREQAGSFSVRLTASSVCGRRRTAHHAVAAYGVNNSTRSNRISRTSGAVFVAGSTYRRSHTLNGESSVKFKRSQPGFWIVRQCSSPTHIRGEVAVVQALGPVEHPSSVDHGLGQFAPGQGLRGADQGDHRRQTSER